MPDQQDKQPDASNHAETDSGSSQTPENPKQNNNLLFGYGNARSTGNNKTNEMAVQAVS
jgi:hypothetical protein